MAVEIDKFDFDPDFLRKKYREEKNKFEEHFSEKPCK